MIPFLSLDFPVFLPFESRGRGFSDWLKTRRCPGFKKIQKAGHH